VARSQPACGNGNPSTDSYANKEATNPDTGDRDEHTHSPSADRDTYDNANAGPDGGADGDAYGYANTFADANSHTRSAHAHTISHSNTVANRGDRIGWQGHTCSRQWISGDQSTCSH
jgi:hypothetical protein